jgi:hypothetical protein
MQKDPYRLGSITIATVAVCTVIFSFLTFLSITLSEGSLFGIQFSQGVTENSSTPYLGVLTGLIAEISFVGILIFLIIQAFSSIPKPVRKIRLIWCLVGVAGFRFMVLAG